MTTLYGLENLWDTDGNLDRFRKNRRYFRVAVEYWQAAASCCIGETAFQFSHPLPEFWAFTKLLRMAAKELFGFSTPCMEHFENTCCGDFDNHKGQGTFPSPPQPVNFNWNNTELNVHRDSYWDGYDSDLPLVPDPEDLRRVLCETTQLIDAAMAIPSPSSDASDSEVEWTTESNNITGWSHVFGVHRDTMRRYFINGLVRAKKLHGNSWIVAVRDLPQSPGTKLSE